MEAERQLNTLHAQQTGFCIGIISVLNPNHVIIAAYRNKRKLHFKVTDKDVSLKFGLLV